MSPNSAIEPTLCCHAAATLVGKGSPFAEIISIEFYDGPVSGVLRCSTCRSVLRYKLLGWDERQEKRVFALAKMPEQVWDRIIALYPHDKPHFPVWVPAWVELGKDDLVKREATLQMILEQKEEWSWVALMSRYLDVLIDFRSATDLLPQIEKQTIYAEPTWQWLQLFGLKQE
jgi:hypothetical protein